jgi:hypothetical protein
LSTNTILEFYRETPDLAGLTMKEQSQNIAAIFISGKLIIIWCHENPILPPYSRNPLVRQKHS